MVLQWRTGQRLQGIWLASIVAFLKSTYGLSDVQKAASENAESNILKLLGWKWQKGHFVDFVRKIHQRVSVLFMHRKLAERPAKSLCLALTPSPDGRPSTRLRGQA